MRPPRFWDAPPDRPGPAARLLAPLSAITASVTARRIAGATAAPPPVPVICVGNLSVGGTGKTPTVIALASLLGARGQAVHVVMRGHGGRLEGPLRVDPSRHGAAEVGDEPLLIAAFAPVWVARDRAAGVRAAAQAGAGAVLLDDGFQNPSVAKTLSIVVVDAAAGFGNGRVLPAGPLREPVAAGLARADLLLSVGGRDAQVRFDALWGGAADGLVRLTARIEPLATGMDWTGLRVLAFAGIGRPEKFFDTLRGAGAEIVRAVPLGDHQPLAPALLRRLTAEARAEGLQLVTTEKDAVRLPRAMRQAVLTLPVRLVFDDTAALETALAGALPPPAAPR